MSICIHCGSAYVEVIGDDTNDSPPAITCECPDCGSCYTEFFELSDDLFLSPTAQGCTPEGGVSANRADDNSTGGVTTPGVTWRASGSHSHGGADE